MSTVTWEAEIVESSTLDLRNAGVRTGFARDVSQRQLRRPRHRDLLLEVGAEHLRRLVTAARSAAKIGSEKESVFPEKQL